MSHHDVFLILNVLFIIAGNGFENNFSKCLCYLAAFFYAILSFF